MRIGFIIVLLVLCFSAHGWEIRTIDNVPEGADGARLQDTNNDGRPDIVTPFEEGGVIMVYQNPGAAAGSSRWIRERAGTVPSPEDAVFADLDGDGIYDVVSCSEGSEKAVWFHWSSAPVGGVWKSELLPASKDVQQWMFCVPMNVDGKNGIDLVCGGKNENASIGWFESPADPHDMAAWKWHPIRPAGWIMSLIAVDMNADGRDDILFSDRRGPASGVYYLERPAPEAVGGPWPERTLGAKGEEVMFIDGGPERVVAAIKPRIIAEFTNVNGTWSRKDTVFPDTMGTSKSARYADMDMDGIDDVLVTCENADEEKSGVFYIDLDGKKPEFVDIAGEPGTKFDLTAVYDLDDDGDLDVITCEERDGLGLFWYENPSY